MAFELCAFYEYGTHPYPHPGLTHPTCSYITPLSFPSSLKLTQNSEIPVRATKPMMKIMGLGGTLDGPNPNQSCVRRSPAGKVRMHSWTVMAGQRMLLLTPRQWYRNFH